MGSAINPKRCDKCGAVYHPTHGNARYCSVGCYMADSTTKDENTGCVLWKGSVDTYGYGHARWHGKRRKAHVMAFELAGGVLSPSMVIRHLCNNTRCCNPQHLRLGTPLENMSDKARSGIVAGERSPKASLTNAQAVAIYALRGHMKAVEAAAQTGTHVATVRGIWSGRLYPSVTGETWRPKGRAQGEANHAAKVTNEQAKAIYALRESAASAAEASRQTGVPYSIVRNIWRGETFSVITGATKSAVRKPERTAPCALCSSTIRNPKSNRKWCSLRCALMANVAKGRPEECWLWTAKSKSRGYGQVQFCGKRLFAHHVAFDLAHPRLSRRRREGGLTISHRCHSPLCCNPKHLELLTLCENVRRNRGRANVSGERNHQAKITATVARRIIEMITAGDRTVDIVERIKHEVGAMVTVFQVTDIRRGRTWQSLTAKRFGRQTRNQRR